MSLLRAAHPPTTSRLIACENWMIGLLCGVGATDGEAVRLVKIGSFGGEGASEGPQDEGQAGELIEEVK